MDPSSLVENIKNYIEPDEQQTSMLVTDKSRTDSRMSYMLQNPPNADQVDSKSDNLRGKEQTAPDAKDQSEHISFQNQ